MQRISSIKKKTWLITRKKEIKSSKRLIHSLKMLEIRLRKRRLKMIGKMVIRLVVR
jgi:hypothetical protein